MILNQPYQVYQNMAVQTATPERLLLMLFEGAIRFCKEAIHALQTQNYETGNAKIIRVQNIINELIVTLDRDVGGELAQNLLSIYQYLQRRLIEANLKKDQSIIEEVSQHLKELYEGFAEAAKLVKGQETKHEHM
ncbi:flagellar export chaperone FliS [Effusibacillus pohliae]|uniref:flagellar export chaperone FliS n=1 Tax=Effusibacillus pohliae TaxID=232270 RepID=UPI00036ACDD1|nr:flagellar export chaperone FliS [Effusibacillus pohliae]